MCLHLVNHIPKYFLDKWDMLKNSEGRLIDWKICPKARKKLKLNFKVIWNFALCDKQTKDFKETFDNRKF